MSNITYVKGDLCLALMSREVDYMIHCCNAQGVMGSGIAKQVKELFPKAFKDYSESDRKLGSITLTQGVINLIGQESYGYSGRHVNYGALADGLVRVREQILSYSNKVKFKVGVPYLMASDRAGGDWDVVIELLEYLIAPYCDLYVFELN